MSDAATFNIADLEAYLEFLSAVGIDSVIDEAPIDRFAQTEAQVKQRLQSHTQRQQQHKALLSHKEPSQHHGTLSISPAEMARNMIANGVSEQDRQKAQAILQRQKAQKNTARTTLPDAHTDHSMAVPNAEVASFAREAASQAQSLNELKTILTNFDGCNLRLTAKNLVFGDGNPNSRIMFIGEAPGRDEDQQGIPFIGRSGILLERMLSFIQLDRTQIYISNVVPWRPPGNRTPTLPETEICRPFIQRQIELVDPEILVFLGAASAKTLSGARDGIRKLRGQWLTYTGEATQRRALATFHPAYLLRNPAEKRFAWRDMLLLRAELDKPSY